MNTRRLNVGCGPDIVDGWTNIDRDDYGQGARFVVDVLPTLNLAGGQFDGAVAHHVLQMVAWPDLVPWLTEIRRVLRPRGWLRLSVPDVGRAFEAHQQGAKRWFPIDDAHERTIDGKFCLYVTQGGTTRSIFTRAWLLDLLTRAGYHQPLTSAYHATNGPAWLTDLDSRPTESFYVEARA